MDIMNTPKLLVSVDNLRPEGLDLALDLDPERLKALVTSEGQPSPAIVSPMTGSLKVSRNGDRLMLKGFFEVTAEIPCDRCLSETRAILSGRIDEVLELAIPGQIIEENDENDGGLEVVDGRVDLTELLSEFFWLAWPFRFICREDCAGLCSRCGADLNHGLCGCREHDWN